MVVGPEQALEKAFALAVMTYQVMERGLAERGLTRARATVLWTLHHGGPMTQRALAEAMGVTPRNVTGLVDALEADGYVARGPHPTDRRATLVSLTGTATAEVEGLRREYDEDAARWFAGVPPADLKAFAATVDHLLVRIAQETC